MQLIELLAPAKNLACGLAAIDHGADAVYIGPERFGARAAAGNSTDDIRRLCDYAHIFGAKVYATVNTIVFDDELAQTQQLLEQLADCGVDAVLVQDMGVMQLAKACGLTVHASTQTDNRTAAKVAWLAAQGARRVVLARELSVDEIAEIHRQVPDVELEVFVHGALCVSYSGLCYASQHCFGRSANRGECAQFCRMKFDLTDSTGRELEHQRHLLSLKDLNQSAHLGELIEAGATSLKIEGRLKDVAYVKNVTAAYSTLLNQFIAHHPGQYERASQGHCTYTFTPDLSRTFNRGYTTYFLKGRQQGIASFDTPKAIGQMVGRVKSVTPGRFPSVVVAGTAAFSNGDGLCFFGTDRQLQGFRVNRAEGNRLFPDMTNNASLQSLLKELRPGTPLYRSSDQAMERLLAKPSGVRKMAVTMALEACDGGYRLTADDGRHTAIATIEAEHQPAQKPQHDYIARELSKLGNTPYECAKVDIPADFGLFIPASRLSDLRRKAIEALANAATAREHRPIKDSGNNGNARPDNDSTTAAHPYMHNVANHRAAEFYQHQGIATAPAFELDEPQGEKVLMRCRHCLRYELGGCVKHGGRQPSWKEPLYLSLADGRRFRLTFDCRHCQMLVTSVP
ncbi:MAG: U32 family peptidase [Prevotella sp.]|nr:U32 family peptidase [Prevotella sp.]